MIHIFRKPREKKFPPVSEYSNFSESDKDSLVDAIFQYHRKRGFPFYPKDKLWRWKKLQQLKRTNYKNLLEEDNSIRQTMLGLSLAWSYMPHSFSVRCGNMRTPMEVYSSDVLFKKAIRKSLSLGHTLSHSGTRKVLRIYTGTQGVSNFRPTASACIYHHFNCKGKVVWDMSSGYGGRLLGANLVEVGKYIGTEPCDLTYGGLQEMISDWISIPTEIHKCGSEEFIPEPESLDFCFTSPPYYNTEKYSHEENQSWVKYPTKEAWLQGFLKKTFENCHLGLKPDCFMLINIADVKTYPDLEKDTIKVAEEVGFVLEDTWKLSLSSMPSADFKFKYEPIFIFRKKGCI